MCSFIANINITYSCILNESCWSMCTSWAFFFLTIFLSFSVWQQHIGQRKRVDQWNLQIECHFVLPVTAHFVTVFCGTVRLSHGHNVQWKHYGSKSNWDPEKREIVWTVGLWNWTCLCCRDGGFCSQVRERGKIVADLHRYMQTKQGV